VMTSDQESSCGVGRECSLVFSKRKPSSDLSHQFIFLPSNHKRALKYKKKLKKDAIASA